MKAVQLQALQATDPPKFALVDADVAMPAHDEVQVRVEAASINPIDVKRAGGYGRRLLGLKKAARFPLTLGNDFVGHVLAVGRNVTALSVGERVIGVKPMGPSGTHASLINVSAAHTRRAPPGAQWHAWCALPYTYTTMRLALAGAGLTPESARNTQVLVHGASGGLGQLALQTLAQWGAEVTAICRTSKANLCRDMGASHVLDRQKPGWREVPAQFNATLNFALWDDEAWLVSRLKPGALGHATTVHPLLESFDTRGWLGGAWNAVSVWRSHKAAAARAAGPASTYAWTVFRPDAQILDELVVQIAEQSLRSFLPRTFSLAMGNAAFAAAGTSDTGRVILDCTATDPVSPALHRYSTGNHPC